MRNCNNDYTSLINIGLLDGGVITLPRREPQNMRNEDNSSVVDIVFSDDDKDDDPECALNSLSTQLNTNACIKDMYWAEKNRNMKPKNVIFCEDQNFNYKLKFYPENVRMKILDSKNRTSHLKDNSKKTQLQCKFRYKNYMDMNSQKLWLLKKIYRLDYNTRHTNRLWRSKSYQRSFMKYEKTKTELRKQSMSLKFQRLIKGNLELEYSGIVVNFAPPIMKLEKIQKDTFKICPISELNKLTIKTNKLHQTSGSILAKIEREVVLFKFDLMDIEFARTWFKITRGTQSTNQTAYVKYWSHSASRFMHCSVPLSTYKYVDPMVKIRQRNHFNLRHEKYPEWMREMRQKRLKEKHTVEENCEEQKRNKKRNRHKFMLEASGKGSQLQLDTINGVLIRMKSGILDGVITKNAALYEKIITRYLRQLNEEGNSHTDTKNEDLVVLQDQDLTVNFL